MSAISHRRHGFTMIEMLIVIAIIGLLAAIAIPSFQNYQHNSKRSEAYTNLNALMKSQKSFFAEHGAYFGVPLAEPGNTQSTLPGMMKRSVNELETAFGGVGWTPDGDVFYDYDSATLNSYNSGADSPNCEAACTTCITMSAYGDVDGDNSQAMVVFFEPDEVGNVCNTGLFNRPPPVDTTGDEILSRVAVYPPAPGVADDY